MMGKSGGGCDRSAPNYGWGLEKEAEKGNDLYMLYSVFGKGRRSGGEGSVRLVKRMRMQVGSSQEDLRVLFLDALVKLWL